CLVDLLILNIQHGVDKVLLRQRSNPVLPAKAPEDGAVAERGLAIEVELRSPPRFGSILELHRIRMEIVASALRPKSGEIRLRDFRVLLSNDRRSRCRGSPAREPSLRIKL